MAETRDESIGHLENGIDAAHDRPTDITIRDRTPSVGSSDSEGRETRVRDKLKKTSIAGLSSQARAGADKGPHPLQESTISELGHLPSPDQATTSSRGRPARKRSFDDLQNDDFNAASYAETDAPPPAKNGHHKRMRSRDISSGEHVSLPGRSENEAASPLEEESDMDAQKSPGGPGVLVDASIRDTVTPPPEDPTDPEAMISPKKKRSRDQFDKEDEPSLNSSDLVPPSSSQKESEPEKKRHREEGQEAATGGTEPKTAIAPSSGFSNTAFASPFDSFASPKSADPKVLSPDIKPVEVKPAEASAFKSSGLSAFASSEKSPFSAVGSPSSSGFGGTTSSGGFGKAPNSSGLGGPSTSGFADMGSTSPFGARSGAGFSSLGGLASTGPFGSASTLGGGLGSGLGVPPLPLGGRISPFGSAAGSTGTFAGPSTTKQKAFGAPEDENDTESGDESGPEEAEGLDAEDYHAREARLKEQTDRETAYDFLCPISTNTIF